MANSRKVVQIFLASPGDLQDERKAAKAVVDAFNRQWADWFGIQVELVGWEDTFKRWGRPQEQINLDLDRCEAFIGVLWRKWGTPPSLDGPYSSGFEEEYERAVAGRRKNDRPEMTLFFKQIDEDFLKDKGPDLSKVLGFRERVIGEKQILFHEFADTRDFEQKLSDWITRYVQALKYQETSSAEEEPQTQAADSPPGKIDPAETHHTPLSSEGARFLRDFISKTERDRKTYPIEATEIARFRLLASMIVAPGNDDGALGTHDANLIFQHRDRLNLSRREQTGLIDAGLDNVTNETVPLWHWYVAADAFHGGYLSLMTLIGSQTQRVGALTAMRLIGEEIKPLSPKTKADDKEARNVFIRQWLHEDSNDRIKAAALEYLGECGISSDLPQLEAEYEKLSYKTVAAAADAIIRINLRLGRDKALRSLIKLQPETVDEALLDAIFEKPSSLPSELLTEGTEHRNGDTRSRIVSIISSRNALPANVAEKLLEDSEAAIRVDALRSLIREGRKFSDEEARSIIVSSKHRAFGLGLLSQPPDTKSELLWKAFYQTKLRSQSEQSLRDLLPTSTIIDQECRFALDFKAFRKRATALRQAIDDGFKDEFAIAITALENQNVNMETVNRLRSFEDDIRKKAVRQATDILCEKSEPEDLTRIRAVVSSGYVGYSAADVEYLKKHGEWQDIPLLISLLDRSEGIGLLGTLFDDKKVRDIAGAVYSVGKRRFPELCFIGLPDRILWRVIASASDKEISEVDDIGLLDLFASDSTDTRRSSLLRAIKACPKTRLKKLLAAHMSEERKRYYNVTYWLDLGLSLSRKQVLHAVEIAGRKRR
jgi:uncharacterized protein DUF4062